MLSKRFAHLVILSVCVSVFGFAHSTHATDTITAAALATLTGVAAQDEVGNAIGQGDFNGDGYTDLLIGGWRTDVSGTQNGAAYVVYGSEELIESGSLSEDSVVRFSGEAEYDNAGYTVSSAGDMDGDGYEEILVGADQNALPNARGSVYLMYGSATPLESDSLSDAVKLFGTQDLEYLGYSASGIGDVNSDGYADIAIGAPLYDGVGLTDGRAFVVYGSSDRLTSGSIEDVGVLISAETAGDSLGGCISAAGDMNGDGYADWMTSAYGYDGGGVDSGALYVVYGDGTTLTDTSVGSFVRLDGEAASDNVGFACSRLGDINNDGFDDVVVGASVADTNGSNSGAAYIIYGSDTELTSQSLSFAVQIDGAAADDSTGYALSGGYDVNGDAYDDIVITSRADNETAEDAGTVAIIFGEENALTSGAVDTLADIVFTGNAAADLFGTSAVLGDFNNDGRGDIAIGTLDDDTGASNAGGVSIGYLAVDADGDRVLGADGLWETGTDCNDDDATVSANQTYYADTDGDGLGEADTIMSVCSSIAPYGYADNDDDTNDAIVNDGVEIPGDAVDNDNDGETDEVNTLDDNGEHPEYGSVDPEDATAVDEAIVSVRATRAGQLRVEFADSSVYSYDVFTSAQTKKPKLLVYPDTGYYVVMTANGRTLALINALDGSVYDRVSLDTVSYLTHGLQFAPLRADSVQEVVITSKKKARVRVALVGVALTSHTFVHAKHVAFREADAKPTRTSVIGNTIDIRSKTLPLASVLVGKRYRLRVVQ